MALVAYFRKGELGFARVRCVLLSVYRERCRFGRCGQTCQRGTEASNGMHPDASQYRDAPINAKPSLRSWHGSSQRNHGWLRPAPGPASFQNLLAHHNKGSGIVLAFPSPSRAGGRHFQGGLASSRSMPAQAAIARDECGSATPALLTIAMIRALTTLKQYSVNELFGLRRMRCSRLMAFWQLNLPLPPKTGPLHWAREGDWARLQRSRSSSLRRPPQGAVLPRAFPRVRYFRQRIGARLHYVCPAYSVPTT